MPVVKASVSVRAQMMPINLFFAIGLDFQSANVYNFQLNDKRLAYKNANSVFKISHAFCGC